MIDGSRLVFGRDYVYTPRIEKPRYEQGADYGRHLRQVLFRRGKVDVCWCPASSHWSGGDGNRPNPASLTIYGVKTREPDLGVDLKEGGRLSTALLQFCQADIEKHLGVSLTRADVLVVCARKPKHTVIYNV